MAGWFLLSTYTDSVTAWSTNQLLFVELVPESTGPRLWTALNNP